MENWLQRTQHFQELGRSWNPQFNLRKTRVDRSDRYSLLCRMDCCFANRDTSLRQILWTKMDLLLELVCPAPRAYNTLAFQESRTQYFVVLYSRLLRRRQSSGRSKLHERVHPCQESKHVHYLVPCRWCVRPDIPVHILSVCTQLVLRSFGGSSVCHCFALL